MQAWLAKHHALCYFPPVHCSWMNQVEQWFSILQRKRLQIADFADKKHLAERLMALSPNGMSMPIRFGGPPNP